MTVPSEVRKLLFKLVNNYDNVRSRQEALYNEKLQCLQVVNNVVGQVCTEANKIEVKENVKKIKTLERKELLTEFQYLEEISGVTVDSNSYQQIAQSSNVVFIDMDLLQVGSEPVGLRCPGCQEDIMTRATYRNTATTHVVALILGFFFWWLCCCIIPYVTKRWKNVEHSCPNCRKHLGVYTRTSIL